ncbi:MAG: hypothetical protein H7A43_05105 [Verrucomicrobia bacterium]|nr:hypothetical protein [Verrucomicrobiota bacterium]
MPGGIRGWALLFAFASLQPAYGVVITGMEWQVLFNLPDQSSSSGFSDDEFRLKLHLVERLAALGSNDVATLATYTFSGNESGAGRYLYEMDRALARGAWIRMIADSEVNAATTYSNNEDAQGRSLNQLAATYPARFTYVEDDSVYGIHHNKLGLFDYRPSGAGGTRCFVSSFNLTGASSFQWNIAVDLPDPDLYDAYLLEAESLLAGHFHDDPAKSHAADQSPFVVDGYYLNRVRFSPSPDPSDGGTNTAAEVVSLVNAARTSIVFAINHLTLESVQQALVAAADRGVVIHGTIPGSSSKPGGISEEAYRFLTNATHYAGTNVVQFHTAYAKADRTMVDDGSIGDLLHAKYMVIDRLTVIHGSMNWTYSAMQDDDQNDENMLILRHPGIARAFLEQYEALTGWPAAAELPAAPADYGQWKLAHDVATQTDESDQDGDGLTLWQEYAFAEDPHTARGVGGIVSQSGSSGFDVLYPATRTQITYRAEAASALSPSPNWSTNQVLWFHTHGRLRVQLTDPSADLRFIRVRADGL